MSKLKRTALVITFLAILVKLSGFLRESIIARQFGANEYTDGYLLSFSFITLVVAMISGGFNNVFLPLYVKYKKNNPGIAEKSANGIMNATVLIFFGVTVGGFFFVPSLVPFIFGQMNPTTEQVAIEVTQVFFLFMSAIALNGILESYLQGRRIFVPVQTAKLLATLMGAIFALLFSERWGIHSLAYGFIVGVLLGTVIQFYYLQKSGFRWKPSVKVEKSFQATFLVLLFPALLNSVVGQINMFVNKLFASGTVEGAVTYLNNASLLVNIPNAIYATTVAAIIFTLLSEQVDDTKKFQWTVFRGLELSLITLLPIAVGLLLVGEAAISFVYERGFFTQVDTVNTYVALVMYVPLIVTQGLQYIISKSMYARGKTAIILKISLTTILLNIILNYLLVGPFGYPGLAISASIVSVYYLGVTSYFVLRDFDMEERTRVGTLLVRVLPATVLMAGPLYLVMRYTRVDELYSLLQLVILIPLGAVLYIGGTYVFYREGFRRVVGLVRK